MRRIRPYPLLALSIALVARPGLAQEPARTIQVSGQGQAATPPDMATVRTGVVTKAGQASEALAANSRAVEKIMEVLKTHKVASKDIQTSSFSVHPEYQRGPRNQQLSEIVGYGVTNQLRVRVRNLPGIGKILDALVNAGSNQISGISFGIDDPAGILNQARNRAVADARARAELYAHAAGVEVGKVISISEQAIQVPSPQPVVRQMAMAAAAVPVATGEQEVTATVHMVFALEER